MTNNEAIEHLKIIDSRYPSSLESNFNDECERIALNMSIKALKERPQGEWIDHGIHIECNQCRVWFLKDHLIRKSFCSNCGAEIQKGGNEND